MPSNTEFHFYEEDGGYKCWITNKRMRNRFIFNDIAENSELVAMITTFGMTKNWRTDLDGYVRV